MPILSRSRAHAGLVTVLGIFGTYSLVTMLASAAEPTASPRQELPEASENAARALPKQPNVLFLAVDDLRPELGCYGQAAAESPHLDRLAADGMRFSRHFVQVPTCGASRYALLTGRSPLESGAKANGAFYQGRSALRAERTAGAQSMPELFRRNGYHTVLIGKISHTADGKVFEYNGRGDGRPEMPHAWDELRTPYGAWERGWGIFFAYTGGRHREDGQGHQDVMEFVAEADSELPDGLLAEEAVKTLSELKDRDQPFFLGLGLIKPHLPFVATRADWEAVQDREVGQAPHSDPVTSPSSHASSEFYRYDMPFPKTRPLATDDQVTLRRAYLACVRFVDRQIGKVLTALDELGLSDDTIVVVWGDHGWHLGESAIWGKHTPWERALHSPLIVRVPGVTRPGGTCDALVETTDLYPTLIDLCDLADRATQFPLAGESLRPLLSGECASGREVARSVWGNAVSYRTETHRLIVHPPRKPRSDPASASTADVIYELYDVTESADPVTNLASSRPDLIETILSADRSRTASDAARR